ncbi:hypothetical protein CsatB_025938 [Cannabis sativa]
MPKKVIPAFRTNITNRSNALRAIAGVIKKVPKSKPFASQTKPKETVPPKFKPTRLVDALLNPEATIHVIPLRQIPPFASAPLAPAVKKMEKKSSISAKMRF